MKFSEIHSCSQLTTFVQQVGFLPLLDSGITGFSADELAGEECRYVSIPGGGWDWPLWKWKGQVLTESHCAYGKFFNRKAGFISSQWWPDFFFFRRSRFPLSDDDSIEATILQMLRLGGSMITRELRTACGFDGKGMRGRFDSFITRLEMGTYVVTEDFVYPVDRHNREYGWGWSLLTTPEQLYGQEACQCGRTPEESYARMFGYLKEILPDASDKQLARLLG